MISPALDILIWIPLVAGALYLIYKMLPILIDAAMLPVIVEEVHDHPARRDEGFVQCRYCGAPIPKALGHCEYCGMVSR